MTDLHAALYVAGLEVEVIEAEVAAGVNVRHAIRALYPHEVTATTRFGEMEDETSKAVAKIQEITERLWVEFGAWLASDLVDWSDTGPQLARRIRDLRAGAAAFPNEQRTAIDRAASQILRQLFAIRHTWARLTRDEALRQGVPAHRLPDLAMIHPDAHERDHLSLLAESIATHPRQRALEVADKVTAAANLLEVDPAALLDTITDRVADTSHKGTVDLARQAVYSAGSTGRWQVAEEAPKPKFVYASELLDGATCGPCAAMDGRKWETIDDAFTEYPSGGGYRHCEGGPRCRGTLVYVWEDEEAPTIDDRGPVMPIVEDQDTWPDPTDLPFTHLDMAKTLDGAQRGGVWNGGHLFGAAHADKVKAGRAGKTCWPRGWSRGRAEQTVEAVVRDPDARTVLQYGRHVEVLHATVRDDVVTVGIWRYQNGTYSFHAVFPVNGAGVVARLNDGRAHFRDALKFNLDVLKRYGIDL